MVRKLPMESTIGPSLSPIIFSLSLSFHPSSPSLSIASWQRSIKPTEQLAMKFGGFIIFSSGYFFCHCGSIWKVENWRVKRWESESHRMSNDGLDWNQYGRWRAGNVLRGKKKSQSSYSIKLIGGDMREKGLIGNTCVREKVCVIEGIMRWNWVGAEILMWQALENAKHFLSAWGFNLYIY